MNIKIYTLMIVAILGISACSTESTTPDSPNDKEVAVEGTFEESIWRIENAELPTQQFRDLYESMEFVVNQNLNYTWTWTGKPGQKSYVFKGNTYYEKSSHTHTSGSAIYNISVNVQTINDLDLPGGWYGIYTYEDENHMSLNVEPDVTNWGDHPTSAGGLGSGQEGNKSVYRFTKQ